MVKVYLYDLHNLKNEGEYLYRKERASEKRRPASFVYNEFLKNNKAVVNLGVSAVLDEAFKEFGFREKDAVIIYGKYGKPMLKDYPGIHFNLSHSGQYVMCAVGGVPVGVDIQENIGNKSSVAKRFFPRNEYERILSCPDEASANTLFYRYWTLKESYVKTLGTGIGDVFGKTEFVPAGVCDNVYGEYMTIADGSGNNRYIFREYSVCGYSAAVCSAGDSNITDIKLIGGR